MRKRGEVEIITIVLIIALVIFGASILFATLTKISENFEKSVEAKMDYLLNWSETTENKLEEKETFHGVFLYGWGSSGTSSAEEERAINELHSNVLILAGNLDNGGLQKAINNLPEGTKYILQPSPLTIVTNNPDKQMVLEGSLLNSEYNLLETVLTEDCVGVIIVHEAGIRHPYPYLEDYLNRFINFLDERNIEPILLLDSPSYERQYAEIMQTDIPDKASIWAEIKTWHGNGDTEERLKSHVRQRIKDVERNPQRKLDGILWQIGGDVEDENYETGRRYPYRPIPTQEQMTWVIDELGVWKDRFHLWFWYQEGGSSFFGLADEEMQEQRERIKELWI